MKKTMEERLFNAFALAVTTVFAFGCLMPLLYTLAGSFTDERMLYAGIKLIPKKVSVESYKMVLKNPVDMLNAYKITMLLVILGVGLGLFITSMTAYVLYRKDFKYRGFFSFIFMFTTLFSGGLIPTYIVFCKLGLRGNFSAMLVANLFSVFNMIVMRSYLVGNIPESLVESAKIDGANDFVIYARIVMPAAKPILATVGLLTGLAYWNDWYNAMLYINDRALYPLQYYLYKLLNDAQMLTKLSSMTTLKQSMPSEGYKMAMTIFTIGPVILFYPFVQKYFVAGVTIGAVKG